MNVYLRALEYLAPCHGSWGTHSMTDETRLKGGLRIDDPMTIYIRTCTNI